MEPSQGRRRGTPTCAAEARNWCHAHDAITDFALAALTKTRLRRMQYRPGLLEGFLTGARLDLTPFCNPQN